MSTTPIQKDIKDYLETNGSFLDKADKTADGTTDDKTPDEPAQKKGMDMLSTDARNVANRVFSPMGTPVTPAEMLVLGNMYDVMQSGTRNAEMYGTNRQKFYQNAASATEARKNNLNHKMSITAMVLQGIDKVKEDQKYQQA